MHTSNCKWFSTPLSNTLPLLSPFLSHILPQQHRKALSRSSSSSRRTRLIKINYTFLISFNFLYHVFTISHFFPFSLFIFYLNIIFKTRAIKQGYPDFNIFFIKYYSYIYPPKMFLIKLCLILFN